MTLAVPYHEVSDELLPSALGARIAINRYFKVPYSNSLLLSNQSLYVSVVRQEFRIKLPIREPTVLSPPVTILGKYARFINSVSGDFATVTGTMGYGERGEEWADGDDIDVGTILTDDSFRLYRYTDNFIRAAGITYYRLNLDGTLALLSDLITDRVSDLPDTLNDVSADENVIPQTIISGLEPMLNGFFV